eukprot:Phypoly_transcript_21767.p1 GENE.Phypoly_transcript_21767~~Phypoly_transcript_21767.p1  ORF type:complete len:180 (+),score=37.58 Phypoly_transcript_21767:46-585(+)
MAQGDEHFTTEINIPLPEKRQIASLNIGVICTCWNQDLLKPLISNTKAALEKLGVEERQINTPIMVPGSFELPFAAQALAQSGQVDVVLCFGLLIKGETAHFEYISNACSQGLMQAQLTSNVPIVYGVLNCLSKEQAEARVGPKSQLPNSLAASVISMASLKTKYYGGQVLRRSQELYE